ncbi:Tat pathway signal protein [Arthrobacter sp. M4]|uniref:Tat pathway signal protein n=1 Tax=Arthrobacter sp. M4 TaxID=218160 RepID=UPI0035AC205C
MDPSTGEDREPAKKPSGNDGAPEEQQQAPASGPYDGGGTDQTNPDGSGTGQTNPDGSGTGQTNPDGSGTGQTNPGDGAPPSEESGTSSDLPKPPPWQVPKPELRPELLNEPVPTVDPFAAERNREAQVRRKRSQRRTVVVGLGVTALLAGTITAIVASNEQEADYAQVCFDDQTGERVDDANCGSSEGRGSGAYAWYFYSRGASVPAVGQNRSSYPSATKTVPSGAKTSTGYSTKGGTVSRGGFGGSAKSGSGGSGSSGGGKSSGG